MTRLLRIAELGEYEDEELVVDARSVGHAVGIGVGDIGAGQLRVIVLLHPPHAGPCDEMPVSLPITLTDVDLEEIEECTRDIRRGLLS